MRFIICTFHKILFRLLNLDDKMCRTCGTCGEYEKRIQNFDWKA